MGAFPGIHHKQQLAKRGWELVWDGGRGTLAFPLLPTSALFILCVLNFRKQGIGSQQIVKVAHE